MKRTLLNSGKTMNGQMTASSHPRGMGRLALITIALASAAGLASPSARAQKLRAIPASTSQSAASPLQVVNHLMHNTWTSGALMPTALQRTAAAVLENQIYVLGGGTFTEFVADTQIYDVAIDAWNMGVPLPIATGGGCAATVKDILYFIGGNTGAAGIAQYTNAVWAYNPKRNAWTSKASMPTARASLRCVVDKGIIYALGGYNNTGFLATVESYDPATNTWAEDASMLSPKSVFAAGLIGNTIVVTDGSDGAADGHTQEYVVTTNTWKWGTSDPTIRQDTCAASIGRRLYSAGGWDGNQDNETGLTGTESFGLSEDSWTTLAPMPQGAWDAGSVAYKGRLYCFGGGNDNSLLNNVQIYQP